MHGVAPSWDPWLDLLMQLGTGLAELGGGRRVLYGAEAAVEAASSQHCAVDWPPASGTHGLGHPPTNGRCGASSARALSPPCATALHHCPAPVGDSILNFSAASHWNQQSLLLSRSNKPPSFSPLCSAHTRLNMWSRSLFASVRIP
jgi:hypothetical protein